MREEALKAEFEKDAVEESNLESDIEEIEA